MALTQARQQSFGQLQNVVPALAQRRELESKQVEPMEQILAKFAFRDELFEIAVSRGDDADVDGKFPRAAQSPELSAFNRCQDFRLHRQRQARQFIELVLRSICRR